MDETNIFKPVVYYETRFRTPLRAERDIGLWVDRLGTSQEVRPTLSFPLRLRQLGQFACVLIENGSGILTTAHYGTYTLSAGELFFIFPDEPTFYYPERAWRHSFIVFNGPDAEQLCQAGYFSKQSVLVHSAAAVFMEAFLRLADLMGDESLGAVLERKFRVEKLILDLYNNRQGTSLDKADRMESIVGFLEEHYHEALTIEALAERCHLSPAHFRRCFKARTGRTPQEFITSLRISRAKVLLSQRYPIKQAAAAVGYSDVFYFMRVFKKTTGMTAKSFMGKNL